MKKISRSTLSWMALLLIPAMVLTKILLFPSITTDINSTTPAQLTSSPPVVRPDLQRLAAQAGKGVAAITPEDIEEERRLTQEQVDTARVWLKDAHPEQRVIGAEQLSAYPTPEAEKLLAESLRSDRAPEVRAAAAQSLNFFEILQVGTLQSLLRALEDQDEDVRFNARKTLERQYSHLKNRSDLANEIMAGFRRKAQSPRVPIETQEAIMYFLRDLEW